MDELKNQICNTKVAKSQALSPVKLHKVKGSGSCGQTEIAGEGEAESPSGGEGVWSINKIEESLGTQATTSSLKELRISQSHSKKVVKHALRQQAKRRRKNTTIASGNTAPISRIVMPPHELEEVTSRVNCKPPTMMEVLSSIPGFSIKPRKRSNKKLSAAAQLEQTKEGCIDLETPDSILVNTNLRSLLNKHTFNSLPTLYQYKLVQLLPHMDRAPPASDSFRLSASGLNNEFFARACLEWRERLAEGEFTPENQQKLKAEAEREKSKLDPWKLKHFEPIWGESTMGSSSIVNHTDRTPQPAAPPKPKPQVKVKTPPTPAPPPRLRTVGAVTRAVANYREKREAEESSQLEPNKRVKSSVKSDIVEPPFTSESSSTPITPSPTSLHSQTSQNLIPATEDIKEQDMISAVEKMEEDVDTGKEDQSPEETSNKCTEVVSEWENVEEMKEKPVQECEELSTQPQECNETSQSDSYKQVCDISTNNEEIESKEDAVPREETVIEKHQETENAQNIQAVNNQERSSVESEMCDPYVDQNQFCFQHEVVADVNSDEADNHIVQEELEDKSVESNHDRAVQETFNRSTSSDICNSESMEVEEETHDSDSKETSTINHQDVPKTTQPDECENIANSPHPDKNLNTTEQEKEIKSNSVNETLASEVEMINTHSFAEAVSEENLDDDRYEADINDSLEYVNEETSTSLQNCAEVPELTNNQDSIDSQGKEDSCNYSVKLEDDLDINDTGSNMQSQDSQDTRIDEETSCHQESDLMIPDSEANMSSGDMSGSEYNMYSSVIYQEALKEDVETAALLAAWGAVGPSTEKLLAEVALQEEEEETHVPVIPMQEDLEIRLEEIKTAPNGCEWTTYEKMSSTPSEDSQSTKPNSEPPQYPGHVKLELEVTLTPTPEVDSQVSSTMENGTTLPGTPNNSFSACEEMKPSTSAPVNVIPPTTFVCLPPSTLTSTVQAPVPLPAQPGVVSSSAAVPYLALTTSTPVRALPTKPKTSGVTTGARSSRNVSTKPPPGAVNLERSYQICQAVIQNSPNRDQLRCQLKPPPSMLISSKDKTQYSVVTSSRGTKVINKQRYQQRPTTPVVVKHVFTSSQGYPVTMAVLPQTQPTNNPEVAEGQTGHYVLVQRAGTQVRRSNSAPPSNNENMVGVGGRGRPASVGEGATGGDSPGYPVKQNMRSADCPCSLKAMIACKKCGAFCHDDCIDPPSRVCVTCLIR